MRSWAIIAGFFMVGFVNPFIVAQAFDQDKCGAIFPKIGDKHPPYFSPLYTSTMVPSTTSYMSSFGNCSMYAGQESKEVRNEFIASTYDSLSREAAAGGGEHVGALASLMGCSAEARPRFSQVLQRKFGVVFDSPVLMDAEALSKRVGGVIAQDSELSARCVASVD